MVVHIKARVETALRLTTGQIHDLGNVEIAVSNWLDTDAAGPLHRGLFFDARARASDYQGALELAMRAADGVLSSLAFLGAAGAGPLVPAAIFRDVPGGCHLRQFIELPLGPSVARVLDSAYTDRTLGAIDALEPDRRDRVYTAISWYRKAALERQPIDAFTASWLGLETLNGLLAQRYGVTNERVERTCPSCGVAVLTAPTSAGIRELLIELGGTALWDKARRRRVALLHATQPLAEVHDDLRALAQQITHALRQGVLKLSGLDEAGRSPTPMPVPRRHQMRADVFLPEYSVTQVPRGPRHPRLRLHTLGTATRRVESGRTLETADTQWELVDFSGPQYRFSSTIEPEVDPDDPAATAEMRLLGQESRPEVPIDVMDERDEAPE